MAAGFSLGYSIFMFYISYLGVVILYVVIICLLYIFNNTSSRIYPQIT